jgi:hypothetical protein
LALDRQIGLESAWVQLPACGRLPVCVWPTGSDVSVKPLLCVDCSGGWIRCYRNRGPNLSARFPVGCLRRLVDVATTFAEASPLTHAGLGCEDI